MNKRVESRAAHPHPHPHPHHLSLSSIFPYKCALPYLCSAVSASLQYSPSDCPRTTSLVVDHTPRIPSVSYPVPLGPYDKCRPRYSLSLSSVSCQCLLSVVVLCNIHIRSSTALALHCTFFVCRFTRNGTPPRGLIRKSLAAQGKAETRDENESSLTLVSLVRLYVIFYYSPTNAVRSLLIVLLSSSALSNSLRPLFALRNFRDPQDSCTRQVTTSAT